MGILSLFAPKKKISPLRQELQNLERAISRTDEHLSRVSEEFWLNDGICCPSCGVPGYSDLLSKQDRRYERVRQIQTKLDRGK